MSKNKFRNKLKVGDYVLYCDTCRNPMWASQKQILPEYSGAQGLVVCPDCYDPVDYGLKPYKIRPEKAPILTRSAHYSDHPEDVPNSAPPFPFDSNLNPESATPDQVRIVAGMWDTTDVTWENSNVRWEDA